MRYFTGGRAAQSDSAIRLGHTAVGMEPLVLPVLAAGRALEKELAPSRGGDSTPALRAGTNPSPGTFKPPSARDQTRPWAAPVITIIKKKARCEHLTHL